MVPSETVAGAQRALQGMGRKRRGMQEVLLMVGLLKAMLHAFCEIVAAP